MGIDLNLNIMQRGGKSKIIDFLRFRTKGFLLHLNFRDIKPLFFVA